MSTLKRKNLIAMESAQTHALPQTMIALQQEGRLQTLPLDYLSPAPSEWNFYKPLSKNKMMELITSIDENGLINPVVVWRRDTRYIILSGHNRVEAYRRLWTNTGKLCYKSIPCIVREGITEEEARELIIDSNWVQRVLSPRERVLSISAKYVGLGRKHRELSLEKQGRTYDQIAADYQLSGRQVARYIQLSNLSEWFLALLDDGSLPIRSACKYALLSEKIQDAIADRYDPLPAGNRLKPLKKGMTQAEVFEILDRPEDVMTTVSFSVPESRKDELELVVRNWLKSIG